MRSTRPTGGTRSAVCRAPAAPLSITPFRRRDSTGPPAPTAASKNAAKLKGVAIYAAASAGGQGDVDQLPPGFGPNFTGELVEGIVADNTRRFADAAKAAGVAVTYIVRPEGSHTWGLFGSEMEESWNTTIGPALGA
jgi:S-formylglutathione hydrolase FrmB